MSIEDDKKLMELQDLTYKIIKEVLKSDLMIEGNVSGLKVEVQDGYVNAEWYFDKREKGDIKE